MVKKRESNIELFRIVTMLMIVAHHFVCNSELINLAMADKTFSLNSMFLQLFGWGGKTGINCFVLITGYFMCKSELTLKKFMKILLEYEFYNVVIYGIFLFTGYIPFSVKELIKTVLPVYTLGYGFTQSFLMLMLLVPFINLLINSMDAKMHFKLLVILTVAYSLIPTFLMTENYLSETGWYIVIYLFTAYLRLYPKKWQAETGTVAFYALGAIVLSCISIVAGALINTKIGFYSYYFVGSPNKILALADAVLLFLFFKNLKLGQNSVINKVAASAFGVLLIHSNCDAMRKWLWTDIFKNAEHFKSPYLILYAIACTLAVYAVCTVIDMLRILLLEKPFFKLWDKKSSKIKSEKIIENLR